MWQLSCQVTFCFGLPAGGSGKANSPAAIFSLSTSL